MIAASSRSCAPLARRQTIRGRFRGLAQMYLTPHAEVELNTHTHMDTTHLVALETRLSHEKARFAADGSEIRKIWIAQIEKEIAREREFLGITGDVPDMTDDEILAELSGE